MGIGPAEFFFSAILCSIPLLALFVVVKITVAVVRYRRQQRRRGPFSGPWSMPPDEDV